MSRHRLTDYIGALGALVRAAESGDDPVVEQVTYDSREVEPGALFICKGVHFLPRFLIQAAERGAVAYLAESRQPGVNLPGVGLPGVDLPWVEVSDIRAAIGEAGTLFYDREWDKLKLIGVTSTKGKSTTTTFIREILAAWAEIEGRPLPGLMTSIRYIDGVVDEEATRTTPETLELYAHLHNAVQAGLDTMCVEVSSQALRYRRVANLHFEIGCFLNISEDHISAHEHPDYEDYLSAKLELFAHSRLAVVNAMTQDADRVLAAARQCEQVVTFALGAEADVRGYGLTVTDTGQEFSVRTAAGDQRYAIGLKGSFNVENALAAVAVATLLGVPPAHIRTGLARTRVAGRMEISRLKRGTTVIVDYAHQKLSVATLLAWARQDYPAAPITMVFGAPGEKALNRRQEFGLLAGQNAAEIYLTEEDPGEVPVEEICRQINIAIEETGHKPALIVPDRQQAIEQAIDRAGDDGLVLILGKGSERWMYRGTTAVVTPSDVDMVRSYIERQDDRVV